MSRTLNRTTPPPRPVHHTRPPAVPCSTTPPTRTRRTPVNGRASRTIPHVFISHPPTCSASTSPSSPTKLADTPPAPATRPCPSNPPLTSISSTPEFRPVRPGVILENNRGPRKLTKNTARAPPFEVRNPGTETCSTGIGTGKRVPTPVARARPRFPARPAPRAGHRLPASHPLSMIPRANTASRQQSCFGTDVRLRRRLRIGAAARGKWVDSRVPRCGRVPPYFTGGVR